MSIEKFHSLISRICAHYDAPPPRHAYQAASLNVHGISFTLFHGGIIFPDGVLMHCDVGTLPVASREDILLRLLQENNQLFDIHSTAFTYDAKSNRIILMCRVPMTRDSGNATVMSTIRLLEYFAGIATRWNRDYFLYAPDQDMNVG